MPSASRVGSSAQGLRQHIGAFSGPARGRRFLGQWEDRPRETPGPDRRCIHSRARRRGTRRGRRTASGRVRPHLPARQAQRLVVADRPVAGHDQECLQLHDQPDRGRGQDDRDRRRLRPPQHRGRSRCLQLAVRPARLYDRQLLLHEGQSERWQQLSAQERRLGARDRARRRVGARDRARSKDPPCRGHQQQLREPAGRRGLRQGACPVRLQQLGCGRVQRRDQL